MTNLTIATISVVALNLFAAVGDDLRVRVPPEPRVVRVDELRPAVETFCSQTVTSAILRKSQAAESVAFYFREVGKVFAGMGTNANFSSEVVERVPTPLEAEPYVFEVRTLIITLYKLAYEDRTRAEHPPIEWLTKVATMFRTSMENGLKNAGQAGL